jgi:hypothetical protein
MRALPNPAGSARTLDRHASGYLQNGQQPAAATFVAAAADVAKSATRAAASPSSFVFIVIILSI